MFGNNFEVIVLFGGSISRVIDLASFRGSLNPKVDELDNVSGDT